MTIKDNAPKFKTMSGIEVPIRGNVEWVNIIDSPVKGYALAIKLKDQKEVLTNHDYTHFKDAVKQAIIYASMRASEVVSISDIRYGINSCKLNLGYSIQDQLVLWKDKTAPMDKIVDELVIKLNDTNDENNEPVFRSLLDVIAYDRLTKNK